MFTYYLTAINFNQIMLPAFFSENLSLEQIFQIRQEFFFSIAFYLNFAACNIVCSVLQNVFN